MHSPPFGTRLDVIQGGKPAGSRSIKTFIEKNQPLLTLHGHIHEAPELSGAYMERIGETLSVNPGQFIWTGRDASRLHAVTFDLDNVEETISHNCFDQKGLRGQGFKVSSG
jgi:Icc-related predicted phosphoesterase